MGKKVLIAMSGGVDSSVAAALMIQKGYDCIGCTMKLQGQESIHGTTNLQDQEGIHSVTSSQSQEDIHSTTNPQSQESIQSAASLQSQIGSEDRKTKGKIQSDPAFRTESQLGSTASPHTCCSLDDVEDARAVARKLGMPYYVFNFSEDFGEKVIDRFVQIYKAGGTPNPCIDCNRYMKFGLLFQRSKVLGCDAVVTGHYARIRFDEECGRWQLLRSNNPGKDQTYVLYAMTQEQLAHTILPLGEYPDKESVREVADQYGFVNSHKPDSQDLCFVPDRKYADYIERRCNEEAPHGDFVDEDGNVLGEHRGLIRYTIGQRKGLGLALPAPLYVSKIDTEKNQVVLTPEDRLFKRRLIAEDFNWIWTRDWGNWNKNSTLQMDKEGQGAAADTPPVGYTCEVTAKPRYRSKEAAATVRVLEGGKVEIVFHEPQRALTTGQAVVLYDGVNVVGGGTIMEVLENKET